MEEFKAFISKAVVKHWLGFSELCFEEGALATVLWRDQRSKTAHAKQIRVPFLWFRREVMGWKWRWRSWEGSRADKTNRDSGPSSEMARSLICFPFSLSRKSSGRPCQRKRYVQNEKQETSMTFFLLTVNASRPSTVLEFSFQCQGAMELVAVGEEMPMLKMHECPLHQSF